MRIRTDYHLRELDDDHLLIGKGRDGRPGTRRVVRLNESAAFLWRSVAGRDFDAAELAALLQREYGLEPAVAQADAERIAVAWEEAGLIVN